MVVLLLTTIKYNCSASQLPIDVSNILHMLRFLGTSHLKKENSKIHLFWHLKKENSKIHLFWH